MPSKKTKEIWEFGDFQTPDELARSAIQIIKNLDFKPRSILEPTCGRGAFLFSAVDTFPKAELTIGVDINKAHLNHLKKRIFKEYRKTQIKILNADFFALDWSEILKDLPKPILIIGNPPWVTSSELGILQSSNLPEKSNFQSRAGLEAITGKSNFDISEWMLLKHLEWLQKQRGMVAMLCKMTVARKVLAYAWKHDYPLRLARLYKINAMKHFNASVDAGFFLMDCGQETGSKDCDIYEKVSDSKPSHTIGYHDGIVISDVDLYEKWKFLRGTDKAYMWRSGIKHDCARVMELKRSQTGFFNGFGEFIQLENKYVYPLFKSSDIGNGRIRECRKFALVTQRYIGEDTTHIKKNAPKTWEYLQSNMESFEKRASSIYRNRPPFSIFGVGDYTFAPWKIAISGFYKKLNFKPIGPIEGRPAIFDDTIYFLPAWSEGEAYFLSEILNSKPAQEFFSSMIFWSDKRPITIDLLKRLNIRVLTQKLGRENEYNSYATIRSAKHSVQDQLQQTLFAG